MRRQLSRSGDIESFSGRLQDEFRGREISDTRTEATALIERRCSQYNVVRPHNSLGYRLPAPEAIRTEAVSVMRRGTRQTTETGDRPAYEPIPGPGSGQP